MLFLKYNFLKLKLRVFLAGHSVAMVTHCVTKVIPMCSPVIGQIFDTMIVASIDKESCNVLETVLRHLKSSHSHKNGSFKGCRDKCDISCFKILDHASTYS